MWLWKVADKCNKMLIDCIPRDCRRSKGRPDKKWRDEIGKFAGITWQRLTRWHDRWRKLEETFVQQWTWTCNGWWWWCFETDRETDRQASRESLEYKHFHSYSENITTLFWQTKIIILYKNLHNIATDSNSIKIVFVFNTQNFWVALKKMWRKYRVAGDYMSVLSLIKVRNWELWKENWQLYFR